MTTIAIKQAGNKIFVASDSLMTEGDRITGDSCRKVYTHKGDLLCFSGLCHKWAKFMDWANGKVDLPDMKGITVVRVCKDGQVLKYDSNETESCDPYPIAISLPYAFGSGGKYAQGAMTYDELCSPEGAVLVASTLDIRTNDKTSSYVMVIGEGLQAEPTPSRES